MSTTTIATVGRVNATPTYLARPDLAVIAALFCGYLAVGLPLPVIELHRPPLKGAMLWCASQEWVALSGALVTGLGCALVFPALGVEALKRVLPANRGSAMGGFVAFLDIAYGLAGPGAGLVAGQFGYAAVYLLGTASALLGAALVIANRSTSA
jgi:hypothetical protein